MRDGRNRLANLKICLDVKDDTREMAIELHYAENEVNNVFETLDDKGVAKVYKKGKDVITKYFKSKVNSELEIYKFRQTEQHPGESMDTFYTHLCSLQQLWFSRQ